METYTYVIIGGGLAGGQAVEGIREVDASGSIALVTQEPHRPYQRPPLSKGYLMGRQPQDDVYVADADRYNQAGIKLLTGVRATSIDPGAKTVALDDETSLGYGRLLLATGGRAKTLPIPGHDLGKVFTLRTIEDSDHIREASGAGTHALVLGGSFIGSEVAASLTMHDTRVTMAFPESRLLERLAPEEMSEWLQNIYAEEGITILAGITPQELLGDEDVNRVKLSNGSLLNID
ncbi:MAG: FAD-dependent oxidoreductase, partial [Anaerolineae bacterium]|nr:FAD-dependent oxidoreductase [Anaerolineae bacterium]